MKSSLRRYSSCSVSGRRMLSQMARPEAVTSRKTKIQRQGAISRMTCPRLGAITGTAMNTIIAMETTCAMRRPEVRSRAMAVPITRAAAMLMPCNRRPSSSTSKFQAIRQKTVAPI